MLASMTATEKIFMLFPEALACSPSALNADRFHAVYCHVHRITLPPSLYSIYSQQKGFASEDEDFE
jgi:hypothetical protein